MRSTRYHVDRVWYWLTDAVGGGLPIPDKVYMVPSRPKSKVYNCFIKLSGILHKIYFNHKETPMALSAACKNRRETRCVYCDVIRKCTPNSPVWAKIWRVNLRFRCDITETPNRPSLSVCGVLTLRYGRGKHVSANHEEAKLAKIPDHLIIRDISHISLYTISLQTTATISDISNISVYMISLQTTATISDISHISLYMISLQTTATISDISNISVYMISLQTTATIPDISHISLHMISL